MNAHFMKKLPKGAEASNILVGELNSLDKPLSAFIRLSEAVFLGDLTEVPVPTRFIFILLGPSVRTSSHYNFQEVIIVIQKLCTYSLKIYSLRGRRSAASSD